ncbi:MAG: 5-(carboxyamino)imidazole ribonucleotide mutase [bacterium]|nr:5-(carboxyamino)imidazole ribonucleotide mutase [bacterium]
MSKIDVCVLMGSTSDWPLMKPAVELLQKLGMRARTHVTSAHRTPERTESIIAQAEADGCRAFICGAGMAAHLAGVVAAKTLKPVLGVPLPGGVLDGVDALLSTVQMPGGIPVATFAVGKAGAKNAAVFAGQMLGCDRAEVAAAVAALRKEGAVNVERGDAEILAEIGDNEK